VDNGWVMVAPDYVGMGTEGDSPYLIGRGQAHSALDALRAVYELEDVSPDEDQAVVWGHSQGGHAALWTGALADDYAPELKIDGVAALSPASDLVALGQKVQGTAPGTIVTAFLLVAYANTYDDVRLADYVRPGARVLVREAAERCLSNPGLAASLIAASGGESLFTKDLSTGPGGDRLRENTPTTDMEPPLLVAQGTADEVVDIAITEAWVRKQCAAGYELDFRTYPDRSHMGVLEADSPLTEELTAWTIDRFEGKPATSTC
jgi:acetyl esterase/lipase